MNSTAVRSDTKPWYRQFWPWFLVILPAAVVVAGFATLGIAIKHADVRVDDSFSKQGLALTREATPDQQAREIALEAEVSIVDGNVRLHLSSEMFEELTAQQRAFLTPPKLSLRFSHPVNAAMDQHFSATILAYSRYEVELDAAARSMLKGRRYLTLEYSGDNEQLVWRLQGECELFAAEEVDSVGNAKCLLGAA